MISCALSSLVTFGFKDKDGPFCGFVTGGPSHISRHRKKIERGRYDEHIDILSTRNCWIVVVIQCEQFIFDGTSQDAKCRGVTRTTFRAEPGHSPRQKCRTWVNLFLIVFLLFFICFVFIFFHHCKTFPYEAQQEVEHAWFLSAVKLSPTVLHCVDVLQSRALGEYFIHQKSWELNTHTASWPALFLLDHFNKWAVRR